MKKLLGTVAATTTLAATVALAGPTTPADAAAPIEIRPAQVERGDDVRIPHLEGRTVVDGEVRVPVTGRYVGLLGASADGGYVVVVKQSGRWSTQKVAPGAEPVVLARGTQPEESVLAGDGARLAVQRSATRRRTVVEVVRTSDAGSVRRHEFGGYAEVLDLQGRRAVVAGFGFGALTWNVATDRTRSLSARDVYFADLSSNRLAFYTGDPYDGGCSVLTRLDRPAGRLWRSCDERVTAVSPGGGRIATVHLLADGLGPQQVWERRARGQLLASYTVGSFFGAIGWESDTDLLLDANGPRKAATVRVSQGTVERASALRDTPEF